jgi:hypothetical protein
MEVASEGIGPEADTMSPLRREAELGATRHHHAPLKRGEPDSLVYFGSTMTPRSTPCRSDAWSKLMYLMSATVTGTSRRK